METCIKVLVIVFIFIKNPILYPVGGSNVPDAVYGCSGKQEIDSCLSMRIANIERHKRNVVR